ncbi:MAG: NAD(P)H-dependent oxidoreductase [Ilumatobacteraceae bacterium]|nr:NAD(P)H-dependent oxidoreductase [Acidimicrobiaceae bacterium]MBP6489351.1 NAD(P)H-dependent oxidoreductase [Ilumatobacteraceae bacterium]MBP7889635.1 NAD(P)H-dependent oxidoreductase [Ilumatobacteraceae bacterium]
MRVHLVYCHPSETSFTAAVRDRALVGLHAAGHDVRVSDLYADGFVPELSAWERTNHLAPPETKPDIAEYAANLRWCEALVLVYPTWWAGQPAMLKGWIDRVWVAGVAYELPEGANRIRPRLHNIRRIVAITTHGSTKLVNALEGEGGKRIVTRSLRVLCSKRARTTWIALYNIDRSTDARRAAHLARVEQAMCELH